ncbi:hypothetical protein [Mesobacillus foraminis]|uniref:hypothetical protein n=1 Tax=Mesobacillus foraminis TaxID=279826 RepID=UPI0013CF3B64|nr:hypothetical protein [Mesobacillus foraminis]
MEAVKYLCANSYIAILRTGYFDYRYLGKTREKKKGAGRQREFKQVQMDREEMVLEHYSFRDHSA